MDDSLQQIAEEQDEAGKFLIQLFSKAKVTEKDLKLARIATSHRGTQVRAHSAITARERSKFMLAKLIYDDPEERQKYLEASTPK